MKHHLTPQTILACIGIVISATSAMFAFQSRNAAMEIVSLQRDSQRPEIILARVFVEGAGIPETKLVLEWRNVGPKPAVHTLIVVTSSDETARSFSIHATALTQNRVYREASQVTRLPIRVEELQALIAVCTFYIDEHGKVFTEPTYFEGTRSSQERVELFAVTPGSFARLKAANPCDQILRPALEASGLR